VIDGLDGKDRMVLNPSYSLAEGDVVAVAPDAPASATPAAPAAPATKPSTPKAPA
jgi:hypothetical protein